MERDKLNKLFLLKIVSLVNKINKIKLSHLIFIFQKIGREENKLTFNYEFEKKGYEAFSKELENDVLFLTKEGFLKNESGVLLTEQGMKVVETMQRFYEKADVEQLFHFYCYTWKDENTHTLMNYILNTYKISVFSEGQFVMGTIDQEELYKEKMKKKEEKPKNEKENFELLSLNVEYVKKAKNLFNKFEEERNNIDEMFK